MNLTLRTLGAALIYMGAIVGASAERVETSFDDGWRFSLGEQHGAEAPGFFDSEWRTLDVPHDWAFEADYAQDAAQTDKGGYKPGGIGWYRKAFDFNSNWKNQKVFIEFDAAYMNSEVWLNGTGKVLPFVRIGLVIVELFIPVVVADIAPFFGPDRPVLLCRVLEIVFIEPGFRFLSGEDHGNHAIGSVPLAAFGIFQKGTHTVTVEGFALGILHRVALQSTQVHKCWVKIDQTDRMFHHAS